MALVGRSGQADQSPGHDRQPRGRPALRWEQGCRSFAHERGRGTWVRGRFVWCGKQFVRKVDGSVSLSMGAYRRPPQPQADPGGQESKTDLTAALTPAEHRQLRALLISYQWLVAQLRFDMGSLSPLFMKARLGERLSP